MLNRTACDVLEEMRTCCKTMNFSYVLGLIEQMQSMVNSMEAKLEDVKDIEWMHKEIKRLKKIKKKLKKEVGEKESKFEDL